MPIEIFAIKNAPGRYALISGHRRLTVFRRLQALGANPEKYATIPAFIRRPASIEAAFAAMVEENEIRAELSPWERGRIAVAARDAGVFPTIDAAVETLFASGSAIKRRRLRTLASLVETMDGVPRRPRNPLPPPGPPHRRRRRSRLRRPHLPRAGGDGAPHPRSPMGHHPARPRRIRNHRPRRA